jgi:hypothetical protein
VIVDGAVKLLSPAIVGVGLFATLCGCKGEGPVDVYLRFVEALSERDTGGAWTCLARPVREHLSQASARLTQMTGGSVQTEPQEMLFASSLYAARGKQAVTVAREEADRVELRVSLTTAGDARVTLVREDAGWKILLPDPSKSTAQSR